MENFMENFNLHNHYEQKLKFLEQKYASLLKWRSQKWQQNFLDLLNSALDDKDKIKGKTFAFQSEENPEYEDIFYDLRSQWFLYTLSKISDKSVLDKILGMLAKSKWNMSESDQKSLWDFNKILLNSFFEDLNEYKQTMKAKDELENLTVDWVLNKKLFRIISRNINKDLKDVLSRWEDFLAEEKKDISVDLHDLHTPEYDEDGNLISSWDELDWVTSAEEETLRRQIRENFTNPIVFFHTIQKIFQKYNYVITAKELWHLWEIFSDIKKWKMVFLTWDTWSGKTELCLLISNLYLDEIYNWSSERDRKKPIIITWNSETDFSDFTMEKIVTSENYLSSSDDALNKDETLENKTREFIDNINKSREFKDSVKEIIDARSDISDEEKEILKSQIDTQNLLEYNIFTKYHLQWIIKAMKEWVPLIIDEMNWIRPEVLLWLNHYFTRKVGDKVSLWNGFSPITVAKWFCIMCTGNDKDENSSAKRYKWRYSIDESLMNRMHRICKWYHEQEVKKFNNETSWDLLESTDMLEYLTKNELYGVILMLLFSKKDNIKFDEIKNNEFNDQTAAKLLTHTESTWFDVIKEKFVNIASNKEKKDLFFRELRQLAEFIKLIQNAFQWKVTMCDWKDIKNMMENSQWFSMRDLLNILNGYKSDTKSLWYHVYNKYIKQIPEDNEARVWVYLIAKEVWFLDKDTVISPDSNNSQLTQGIENLLLREKQWINSEWDNIELMNLHNNRVNIDNNLLNKWRLIVTKQDIYSEYFWKDFGKWIEINEDEINNFQEEEEMSDVSESIDYDEDLIADTCDYILRKIQEKHDFFKVLPFKPLVILKSFCERFSDINNIKEIKLSKLDINEIWKILTKIDNAIENFNTWDGIDDETINLIQSLKY